MAINVVTWVWDNSPHSGTALLLLLAIADNTHDDGGGAYPSIKTLAKKARISERNVHYGLRELITSGSLRCEYKAGPHGVNVYAVVMEDNAASITVKQCSQCNVLQGNTTTNEVNHNIEEDEKQAGPCNPASKTLQSSAGNPAIAIAPDPLRSVIDPSLRSRRSRAAAPPIPPFGVPGDRLDPSQIPRKGSSQQEGGFRGKP